MLAPCTLLAAQVGRWLRQQRDYLFRRNTVQHNWIILSIFSLDIVASAFLPEATYIDQVTWSGMQRKTDCT
jgi:hypothetical protein